ncbi:MAG: glycosyltransferase [Patescibacteria group bacterium]|mgnify:FL=1
MNAQIKERPFTVTVGIPAYNEEANIAYLIDSIVSQNQTNFNLKKIVVISDGSTDETGAIVHCIAQNNPLVRLVNYVARKGKAARLNELYARNESDIFIQFDADILLSDNNVISRMVEPFLQSDVISVAGYNKPLSGKSFFEKVTNATDLLWHEITKDYNNGDNIYSGSGCATALRRCFTASFRFPFGTIADQQELYFGVKKMNGRFHYAIDAVVYYRSPGNVKDFIVQATRALTEKSHIKSDYNCDRASYYFIPMTKKMRGIISAIAKDPFYTVCAIVLQVFLRIRAEQVISFDSQGLWKMVSSTKNLKK